MRVTPILHLYDPAWRPLLSFMLVRLRINNGDQRVDLFVKRVLETIPHADLDKQGQAVGLLGVLLHNVTELGYSVARVPAYTKIRNEVLRIFDRDSTHLPLSIRRAYLR